MRVTITTSVYTDVSPERIREALLDFSEKRLVTWSRSLDPATYEVHEVGDTWAVVTEGTKRPFVWSKERYVWGEDHRIVWTTTESNFCTPGSHVSMDIVPNETGGSRVHVVWDRTAANLRGRVNLAVIRLGGTRLLRWATRKSLSDVAQAYHDE